jgi:hypothetical protein
MPEHDSDSATLRWHYGAVGPAEGDVSASFRVGDPIDALQHEKLLAAQATLIAIGPGSPFAALHDQFRLFQSIYEAAVQLRAPGHHQRDKTMERLNSAIDNVLFAFRAFCDRTAHQLSQRYGKSSDELTAFTVAASHEFDQFIEYRLAVKLRNYSQHVGHVITSITATGHLEPDGSTTHTFTATIDPKGLLARYDSWGPVKRDLEAMDDVIHVQDLVHELEQCCKLIMAKVVLAQQVTIDAAMQQISTAVEACELTALEHPFLIGIVTDGFDGSAGSRFKPTMSPIRQDLVQLLALNLRQAADVVSASRF